MSVYRSAQGRQIDMSALAAKNEKIRAVGNMNVNARGDVIDNNNHVVKENTNRVKNTYNRTVGMNPTVDPTKKKPATAIQKDTSLQYTNTVIEQAPELSTFERELFEDDISEQELQEIKSKEKE